MINSTDIEIQASQTANNYFQRAIQYIDKEFGEGYAKEHPELIGAFMKTAATNYSANWIEQIIDFRLQEISNKIG